MAGVRHEVSSRPQTGCCKKICRKEIIMLPTCGLGDGRGEGRAQQPQGVGGLLQRRLRRLWDLSLRLRRLRLCLHEGPERRVIEGCLGGDGRCVQYVDAVLHRYSGRGTGGLGRRLPGGT
eukprot:scaffold174270_cov14-Tisochrysis_lutea.AAC.1